MVQDECAEGAEACSLEALQRRAIQLEASQEEPAWEESVLLGIEFRV